MINVYVDSAPGTFDQGIEKNGQQRFQTDCLLFTVWPINRSKDI